MPATEQTWRDQKKMHIIFGVSSLLMLLFTIWMMVQDHDRGWKKYQQTYSRLESWYLYSQILERETNGAFQYGVESREDLVTELQGDPPEQILIDVYNSELRYDAARRSIEESESDDAICENPLAEVTALRATALAALVESRRTAINASERYVDARLEAAGLQAELGESAANSQEFNAAVARYQRAQQARNGADGLIQTLSGGSQGFRDAASTEDADAQELIAAIADSYAALTEGADAARRASLMTAMTEARTEALFREQQLQQELKFLRAEFDGENSLLGIAIGKGDPPEIVDELDASVEDLRAQVQALTLKFEAANRHRLVLDDVLAVVNSNITSAEKARDAFQLDLERLQEAYADAESIFSDAGREIVTLPVLDAFNNTDLEVKHIWLPDLTQNYNHKQVARFDRCITCHLGIEKTAAGTAAEPAYLDQHLVSRLQLPTPESAPAVSRSDNVTDNDLLFQIYGMQLSPEGIFSPDDALIEVVAPRSAAANALLQAGDVVERVYVDGVGVRILSRADAIRYLLDQVKWGQPIVMDVQRGVPQPYGAHPRLDLYGTDSSPHPFKEIGCTICHEGQGNATEFRWTSHSPNDLAELEGWAHEYEWFDNHHWIYPMYPERFQESSCLRCHHSVMELNPSPRFPEPPAPKLMAGYDLVRTYGCFGCHDVNGYAGANKTVGPDLRLEPNYVSAAQQVHVDPRLDASGRAQRLASVFTADATPDFQQQIQQLASAYVLNPDDDEVRHELEALIKQDAQRADPSSEQPAYLQSNLHGLALVLADQETPGSMRKVGPSLRFLNAKVDRGFLYEWIMQPSAYRPGTRMPQFFGQYGHFLPYADSSASNEPEHTRRLEQVEAYALTRYLERISQPFAYVEREALENPSDTLLPADPVRGRGLFETKGCLACHSHADFPEANQSQGPDLTYLGDKLVGDKGRRWLESWLRQPSQYHARTKMPDLFLQPQRNLDAQGMPKTEETAPQADPTGQADTGQANAGQANAGQTVPVVPAQVDITTAPFIDPAADIAAFLLASTGRVGAAVAEDTFAFLSEDAFQTAMDELAMEHLRGPFSRSQAERFLANGIPTELGPELKGDEIELVVPVDGAAAGSHQDRLWYYLGRKTVGKYGCFGCHDIPGYEGSKSIGTGLADWGRKDATKLAFEQVGQLIHATDMSKSHVESSSQVDVHASLFQAPEAVNGAADGGEDHGGGDHDAVSIRDLPDHDTQFYLNSLLSHQRTGFLWQKLRDPRSYDYTKTEVKGYNERLKMPLFPLDKHEREQVMTFVLGLVADPPAEKYVYGPDARQQAINAGNVVLEKYNCAGCHELEVERWAFNYDPADPSFAAERPFPDDAYEIFRQFHTPDEIAASRQVDKRGLGTAYIKGRKTHLNNGELYEEEGFDEGDPATQFIDVWESTLINGQTYLAGDSIGVQVDRFLPKEYIPPRGGFLARYLQPVVYENVLEKNPAANRLDSWAWVPPPLFNQGTKVQNQWLYEFLIEPYPIRPSVVLRMPKFNMSRDEARALADYFAARDDANFPYSFDQRREFQALESRANTSSEALTFDDQALARFDDAMRIVTNGNYCIKCHKIGDHSPGGDVTALGPNLERVYERLRPDFLELWLANPKSQLNYTAMPQNFSLAQPIRENLFQIQTGRLVHEGTSQEQLEAVVDLLLNYDWYMRRRTSIKPLINDPPAGAVPIDGNSPAPNDD